MKPLKGVEDDLSVFKKVEENKGDTHFFGGSGRFWIALVCAVTICIILVISVVKGTTIDAAGSIAILASIASTYMGQNKSK